MRIKVLCLLTLLFCLIAASASADMVFSEVMASNGVYTNGEAYDWVEIHNTGKKTVDLSGWYLSDSKKNPTKWAFPAKTTVKAGGYILVYCTGEDLNAGKNGTYYASFKISASGDRLILTEPDGETQAAYLDIPAQYGNVSWGLPEGGSEYLYFEEATPGKKNPKTGYASRADAPVILTAGGFYDAGLTVTVQAAPESTVRYTLDGSTPRKNPRRSRRRASAFPRPPCCGRGRSRKEKCPPPRFPPPISSA